MDYLELEITINPFIPWNEIVISQLADKGFESFTENDGKLQAYIQKNDFSDQLLVNTILTEPSSDIKLSFTKKVIASKNWNEQWEADFSPVSVDKELIIRAPFHKKDTSFKHDIIIQPQMSFGTGHHQTTWLISKVLLDKDLSNQSVLDVGTGTGVLTILARKLGAKRILGTDIEQNACNNAIENLERNRINDVPVLFGDIDIIPDEKFDLVIANINKNVLKKHLPSYANFCKAGGTLLLSGFFTADTNELIEVAKNNNFEHIASFNKEDWAVLEFKKLK